MFSWEDDRGKAELNSIQQWYMYVEGEGRGEGVKNEGVRSESVRSEGGVRMC